MLRGWQIDLLAIKTILSTRVRFCIIRVIFSLLHLFARTFLVFCVFSLLQAIKKSEKHTHVVFGILNGKKYEKLVQ